jgi:hypothetical protein
VYGYNVCIIKNTVIRNKASDLLTLLECIKSLFGKSQRREVLRHRWADNVEMDLREICEGVNKIYLAEDGV